jgi:hypothetical protein
MFSDFFINFANSFARWLHKNSVCKQYVPCLHSFSLSVMLWFLLFGFCCCLFPCVVLRFNSSYHHILLCPRLRCMPLFHCEEETPHLRATINYLCFYVWLVVLCHSAPSLCSFFVTAFLFACESDHT